MKVLFIILLVVLSLISVRLLLPNSIAGIDVGWIVGLIIGGVCYWIGDRRW